ncbi:hypothetical protein IH980_02445 [Patescibacteria group bacterium]|nr:hypothetical protein [Patescibacteria group bacterium]
MLFFLDPKKLIGRAFIKFAAKLSYKSSVLQNSKVWFGKQFILACIYGGEAEFLKKSGKEPATILFRPASEVENLELWECSPSVKNCDKTKNYNKSKAKLKKLLGGSIYAFITNNFDKHTYYIVKGKLKGIPIHSTSVVSKLHKDSTKKINKDLKKEKDFFRWSNSKGSKFWISFLLIAEGKNMLTAVYTFKNFWNFPSLKNIPYHYHKEHPVPKFKKGKTYKAMYMPVDKEGWIPFMSEVKWKED